MAIILFATTFIIFVSQTSSLADIHMDQDNSSLDLLKEAQIIRQCSQLTTVHSAVHQRH